MMRKLKILTKNADETFNLGLELGNLCKGGEIFALSGDLGAGKTVFTKGLGRGLGVKSHITSPSFLFVKTYFDGNFQLVHFDFYRLETEEDLYSIGFEEYFEKDTVIAIEWAEKFWDKLPKTFLRVEFFVIDENTREINFEIIGKMDKIKNYLERRYKS